MFFEESFGSVLVFEGLAEVLLCRDFSTLMLVGGPCIYRLLKACLWDDFRHVLCLNFIHFTPLAKFNDLVAYFESNLQFLLVL